jgi:predicted O-methyltransferase YrrM
MFPRHWTPRYFRDRFKLLISDLFHPRDPWLTRRSVIYLEHFLRPEFRGLEWGSGRSTRWFGARTASLISIETNPAWHEKTRKSLPPRLTSKVRQILELDPAAAIRAADSLDPESLDYILVDGRPSRGACCLAATGKLKPGGILILDNANRYLPCGSVAPESRALKDGPLNAEFEEFLEKVKKWETIWTSNGVTDTAIFQKPAKQTEDFF